MASYTQGVSNQLTVKRWDKLLHEAVQNKLTFKGMIGRDKGGEGSLDSEVANFPIVEKTQLGKEAGDAITMGLVHQIGTEATWYNDGKAANTTLAGSEVSLTLSNTQVRVGHFRIGVSVTGKLTLQRSPYDLLKVAKDMASTRLARFLDHSVIFTLYAGWSPDVIRDNGTTAITTAAPANIIYGKDKTGTAMTDISNLDANDIVDTDMLERLAVLVHESNFNPVRTPDGDEVMFLTHPRGAKTLRADSAWLDAQRQAAPRSKDNLIFTGGEGSWGGIFVKKSNDIATAASYASLSVANDAFTAPTASTVAVGVAADYRMNLLIGANAVARAFALESYIARRKDDDYENIFGFAGGFIHGDRRADFYEAADTGTDGTRRNQSSALVFSYSPNVNANFTAPW